MGSPKNSLYSFVTVALEATYTLGGKTVNVAIASGLANARKIIDARFLNHFGKLARGDCAVGIAAQLLPCNFEFLCRALLIPSAAKR